MINSNIERMNALVNQVAPLIFFVSAIEMNVFDV